MKIKILLFVLFKGLFIFGQTSNDVLEIPVIFHIVKDKKLRNVEHTKISQYLDLLIKKTNERMNFYDRKKIVNGFDKIAIPTKIKLYRPKYSPKGKAISNTFWYSKSIISNNIHIPIINDLSLRKWSKNPKRFLNIWIVDLFDFGIQLDWCSIEYTSFDIGGYTPSKFHLLDGIILDSDNIFDIIVDPFILIHEFGHYLGLKHIWGDKEGCKHDDNIADTPTQEKPHIVNVYKFIQNSCEGIGKTNHQNFMDYSYDIGMFTEEQVKVIRNNIKTKRAGLLWKHNYNSNSQSVLSNTKQRTKFGTRMITNHLYPYGTITDRDMVELFNSIGIVPTKENLEKIGLKIIGTDKFKDLFTGKLVSQDYIYKYLDILNAKKIINKNSSVEKYSKPKLVQYYDVKKRQYYNESELFKKLSKNQISTFKKVRGNVTLTKYYVNMTFEIYQDNRKVTPVNLYQDDNIASFNLHSGTYRIICKVQSSYLGNGYKEVSYIKELADITFEHLQAKSKQSVLLIRENKNNEVFYKVVN